MMQLAQVLKIGEEAGGTPIIVEGPLNRPGQPQFTNLASVVSNALPFIYPIAGILVLAYFLWGGFEYLTSMGDPKKAEAARGKLTNAVVGFVIIFTAYWIVQIVDYVFKLGVYK